MAGNRRIPPRGLSSRLQADSYPFSGPVLFTRVFFLVRPDCFFSRGFVVYFVCFRYTAPLWIYIDKMRKKIIRWKLYLFNLSISPHVWSPKTSGKSWTCQEWIVIPAWGRDESGVSGETKLGTGKHVNWRWRGANWLTDNLCVWNIVHWVRVCLDWCYGVRN